MAVVAVTGLDVVDLGYISTCVSNLLILWDREKYTFKHYLGTDEIMFPFLGQCLRIKADDVCVVLIEIIGSGLQRA